jgi:hypothetical protein
MEPHDDLPPILQKASGLQGSASCMGIPRSGSPPRLRPLERTCSWAAAMTNTTLLTAMLVTATSAHPALINAPLTQASPLTVEQLYRICTGSGDNKGLCAILRHGRRRRHGGRERP